MFERTRDEWIAFLDRYNLKCQWFRGGRYFIISDISKKLAHLARLVKPSESFQAPDTILKIDSALSPLLGNFLQQSAGLVRLCSSKASNPKCVFLRCFVDDGFVFAAWSNWETFYHLNIKIRNPFKVMR